MSALRFACCPIVLLALLAIHAPLQPAAAEQLRIETHVYVGDESEAMSHTVTLFDSTAVYDFVDDEQIIVFRAPASAHDGKFILLNLETKQRTEVSTERIAGLMEKLNRWAGEQDDELLQFCAKPEFTESFDEETGVLTLESPLWNYSVATVPAEDKHTLHRFREFMDWYTKLNAMMYSTPPPGARLRLNAVLELRGVVPVEIRRTLASESDLVRATHLLAWRLSREDRGRIDQAQNYLASFEKVDNEAYLAQRAKQDVVRGQSD